MSSGKRASQLFLKDKFTVHRFCFLPLLSVFIFFFLSHSVAVFVMDVVSCMGNYISICTTMCNFNKEFEKLGYLLRLSSKSELQFQHAEHQ